MKKLILIAFTLFIFSACKEQNNIESSYSYINNDRVVYYNGDSTILNPFEQFNIVRFEKFDTEGMGQWLVFRVLDTLQTISVNGNKKSTRTIDEISIRENNLPPDATEIVIKLKTDNGISTGVLTRRLENNKTYKIIYSYFSDSEFHRLDPPSDSYQDGYYIVDIVESDKKFEREKNKERHGRGVD